MVTIKKLGSYSGRLFGIQVEATASNQELIENNGDGIVNIPKNFISSDSLAELPFPVCLFFFTLDNDQGYYQWVVEPVIAGKNISKLVLTRTNIFRKLDDKEINDIISTVNNWYDNRSKIDN